MKKIACMLSMLLILISANAQTLRGDVNGDGIINEDDLNIVWLPAHYLKASAIHCEVNYEE